MDILKVLSRGTKKTSNANSSRQGQGRDAAAAKLPSAGARANPQLFHDEVRGQKRKRVAVDAPETKGPVEADLPEVDFFAPKTEATTKAAEDQTKASRQAPSPATTAAASKQLTEDECRQILKSHRLKLTFLLKPESSSRVNKPGKKSKKNKKIKVEEVGAAAGKDEKKSLFPQPLMSFSELRTVYEVSSRVSENLATQSYREPTEVQLGSLPLLLRPELALKGSGEELGADEAVDFLAVAPTGSGKTISFLIPAINRIMRRRALEKLHGVHDLEAIVVAPTRELAHQIVNEGRKLTQGTTIRIIGMKKHMEIAAEKQDIAEPDENQDEESDGSDEESEAEEGKTRKVRSSTAKADILVTTPLLLLHYLTSSGSTFKKVLPTVRDLILDEADVLLDPLFREQTLGIWAACTNPDLRTSCWSATMGSNIETLVTDQIKSRQTALDIPQRPFIRLVVGLKDTAVPNITHKLTYTATEQGKLLALRQLLRPAAKDDSGPPLRPPFLVFTQTIDRATALHEELKYDIPIEAGGSTRIAALHSGLSDSARATIMRRFRAGEIWVMITTDVLARGVDFAGVNGVVNFDVPGSSAAYVHRAGRTGRAGREGGVAVTFYTKEDIPFVKTVANVIAASERQAGKTGEGAGVQKWLLDALPKVNKADRKKLRERGVEARRSGYTANITSTSGFDRRRENNRRGAMEASKRRRQEQREEEGDGEAGEKTGDRDEEWGGFDD